MLASQAVLASQALQRELNNFDAQVARESITHSTAAAGVQGALLALQILPVQQMGGCGCTGELKSWPVLSGCC